MDAAAAASTELDHPTSGHLDAGVDHVVRSPSDVGTVELIVARPDHGEREVLAEGELIVGEGLRGDNYLARGDHRHPEGTAHPEAQLNLMNSRALDLCSAGRKHRWPLAGDQFIVDFDLSVANAPTGTRLRIGTAVIEVSAKPHTGCAKFRERFGVDAARWVNSRDDLRFRGINAMVVEPGVVRQGDTIEEV